MNGDAQWRRPNRHALPRKGDASGVAWFPSADSGWGGAPLPGDGCDAGRAHGLTRTLVGRRVLRGPALKPFITPLELGLYGVGFCPKMGEGQSALNVLGRF